MKIFILIIMTLTNIEDKEKNWRTAVYAFPNNEICEKYRERLHFHIEKSGSFFAVRSKCTPPALEFDLKLP